MEGAGNHPSEVVVVRGKEDGEEGVCGIKLGRGCVVWHVGDEEGGDGVKEVGEGPGPGCVASIAVLARLAGSSLAQSALPAVPREVQRPGIPGDGIGQPAEDAPGKGGLNAGVSIQWDPSGHGVEEVARAGV